MKSGNIQLLGLHAYLREEEEQWTIHGVAANDPQEVAGERNEVRAELQRRMHAPIPELGQWLQAAVRGHIRYCGVPLNTPALWTFRFPVGRFWHRALSRRSQNGRVLWDRMRPLITCWLPGPTVCHTYPLRRTGAVTQGNSRAREIHSSGSVEGCALQAPYAEPQAIAVLGTNFRRARYGTARYVLWEPGRVTFAGHPVVVSHHDPYSDYLCKLRSPSWPQSALHHTARSVDCAGLGATDPVARVYG